MGEHHFPAPLVLLFLFLSFWLHGADRGFTSLSTMLVCSSILSVLFIVPNVATFAALSFWLDVTDHNQRPVSRYTHWNPDKMTDVLWKTCWKSFSCIKNILIEISLKVVSKDINSCKVALIHRMAWGRATVPVYPTWSKQWSLMTWRC